SLRNRCRDDRPVRFDHRYGSRTGDPKIPGSDAYAIQDCKRESDSACYAGRSGPNYGQRDFHPEDCEERRRTVMQQHSLFSGQPPQQPQATSKSETGLNVLTVSQLTADIKMLLEAGLPHLWVEGEITNFTQSGNGHFYFSLKDERAIIRCVMWKSAQRSLKWRPKDGMKVIISGRLMVYEQRGDYQIEIRQISPHGKGDLYLAFEQLKEKLQAEGLFDPKRKKPI